MKKLLVAAAVLAAAVAGAIALTVPRQRLQLPPATDGSVPGLVHVHTNRSDGRSSPDEIAAAAARAGLKFLVFTDHGDGTRSPDPPAYRSGVLCLDGVEISTTGGHYVALDMPAAPYPLGGEPRDVIEDVRRLGGFGIAAHPDSPKAELRWREWTAPFDGIELLNPDTSWRLLAQHPDWRTRGRLAAALLDYPVRPVETIADLIQPSGSIAPWEALMQRRRVVSIAGVDAHARLGWRSADPAQGGLSLPIPGYQASFQTMSIRVTLERPFTGRAPDDAALLMRAIREGHLYTAVDGIATPPAFQFSATNDLGTVHEGDDLAAAGPVALRVESNAPPEFTTILHEGSRVLASVRDAPDWTVHASAEPNVYWVEIVSTGRARPQTWIRSNAIYIRGPEARTVPPARPPAQTSTPIFDGRATAAWRTEHDASSVAAVDMAPAAAGGSSLLFRYGLSTSPQPVAALVLDTPHGLEPQDRLAFTIRADRPTRVSVQLRGGDDGEERWQRSVYAATFDAERTVYFDDLTPIGLTHTFKPPLAAIRSILFVVDTTNARPGTSGSIWITGPSLQH